MKYKKTKLRPVVSRSLLKDFNDIVAADLKSINGILILLMIYHATRFGVAAVDKSKKKEVVDAFIMHWIAIFGLQFFAIFVSSGKIP